MPYTPPDVYISLSQLNRRIKNALAELESQHFWILAEVSEINKSARGHVYLELVEKNGNNTLAKMQGVIWYSALNFMLSKLGNDTFQILKKGNKVLLKAKVDFHTVYGIKLVVNNLDPSVTLGEMEMRRMETLKQLHAEGLVGLNAQLPLPSVLQRIAVISSETAAGYGDFVNQLQNNEFGYAVRHRLFPSAMQGDNTAPQLIGRLREIGEMKQMFDAIVIIRGGGSKFDLDAFNDYQITAAIANFPLPVLTGIGHQQDKTLSDLTAHTALKTPTAVAEFILNGFARFESEIWMMGKQLQELAGNILQDEKMLLTRLESRLQPSGKMQLRQQTQLLANARKRIGRAAANYAKNANLQLEHLQRIFALLDVEALLRRGFTITQRNGKNLASGQSLKAGDIINTRFADGSVESTVNPKNE